MLFTLFWLAIESGDFWFLKQTEIYVPPAKHQTALSETGEMFLLHRDETAILHFGRDGGLIQRFGRRGQGPGELERPTAIWMRNGLVFVDTQSYMHSYTKKGKFVDSILKPSDIWLIKPSATGWVGLKGLGHHQRHLPLQLLGYDRELSQLIIFSSWDSEKARDRLSPIQTPQDRKAGVFPLGPVKDKTYFEVSADGKVAYVKPAHIPKISLIDTENGNTLAQVPVNGDPVPFDSHWGKAYEDMVRAVFPEMMLKPQWADIFPLISSVQASPYNRLIVTKWAPNPKTIHETYLPYRPAEIVVFDHAGLAQTPTLPEYQIERVYWVKESDVYFLFSDGEAFSIGKCKAKDLGSYLQRYPLHFDAAAVYIQRAKRYR